MDPKEPVFKILCFRTHDINEYAHLVDLFAWMETEPQYAESFKVQMAAIQEEKYNKQNSDFAIIVKARLDVMLHVVRVLQDNKYAATFPFVEISDITHDIPSPVV